MKLGQVAKASCFEVCLCVWVDVCVGVGLSIVPGSRQRLTRVCVCATRCLYLAVDDEAVLLPHFPVHHL